jgi:CheY-like chemotaxis protein
MTDPAVARRSKIVMVVDDSWENLLHLQNLIESHGYVCLAVPSGQDCLELVNRAPPRVILLDIEMPAMDGFETCRRLRRNLAMRRVPIMFLTARKTAEAVRTGIGVGGNDFVVKPPDPAKLLERIDHWASTHLAG